MSHVIMKLKMDGIIDILWIVQKFLQGVLLLKYAKA